jgi:hypothetical protein
MKKVIGVIIIVLGLAVGLYLGVYWALWGGLVDMYQGLVGGEFLTFGWGAIKFFILSGSIGYFTFASFFVLGLRMLE